MCFYMQKTKHRYSEEEKLSLLREYYQLGQNKKQFCKSHGLSCTKLLNDWLQKYADAKGLLPLPPEQSNATDMANRSKEDYKEEVAQLKRRIKELEKALAFSQLETEARDIMISKAEEYFNVPIRKKSGAK